jgi:O-antigen/teichoic acid export membrane protein
MEYIDPPTEPGEAPSTGWSVAGNSLYRFVAEGAAVIFMAATGVVVARSLGPNGKGIVATLSYFIALLGPLSTLGLGDASIIQLGQRRVVLREAVSAMLGFLPLFSITGAMALLGISFLQFRSDWESVRAAAIVAAVAVPILASARLFAAVADSQRQIVFTSAVHVLISAVTALSTLLLVFVFRLEILGATLALLLGSAAGLMALVLLLKRLGVRFRPRWQPRYLVPALRLGVPIQVSHLLAALSTRIDLVILYLLAGKAAAGHYSVALTLGLLVTFAPYALSVASFPPLASLDDRQARSLTTRLSRITAAAALVSGLILLLLIPIVTPLLYGPGFKPSVAPALILLMGGVLSSEQWVLSRIAAARGNVGLFVRSYVTSLLIMVAFDFLLIPAYGTIGAAWASIIGSAAGMALVVGSLRRFLGGFGPGDFLPRLADFRSLVEIPWRLVSSRGDVQE